MNTTHRSKALRCNPRIGLSILIVGLLAIVQVGDSWAQDNSEANGFEVFSGRVTFRRYCASCHGADGMGDGNIAQYLKVQPANLTEITLRNGGEFPIDQIHEYIDGRRDVAGHGTREMPVWGEVFQSSLVEAQTGEGGSEERADRVINQLVKYLESIQVE